MNELFVQKTIDIQAPNWKVWHVLTHPDFTREWVTTWWPDVDIIESKWDKRSSVVWNLLDGSTGAEGKVVSVEPFAFLQYTFKTADAGFPKQEEITYILDENEGVTHLSVLMGNFADTPEHERCYKGAVESWDKSLPKIKELAEQQ